MTIIDEAVRAMSVAVSALQGDDFDSLDSESQEALMIINTIALAAADAVRSKEQADSVVLGDFDVWTCPIPAKSVPDGWQPIETAPLRDAVLVHHAAHWHALACKHEDGSWWRWRSPVGNEPLNFTPTHWQPIPAAPEPPK